MGFRTRKIQIDAAGSRSLRRQVNPKKMAGGERSKVSVRAVDSDFFKQSPVPEEYRTIEHGRSSGWGFLVFLFFLFVATVAGFYFWNNRTPAFQGDSVHVSVTADEGIVSGEEITYFVSYENQDVVGLKTVELDVQWPDGFYYDSSSEKPTSDTATTWMLGPLDAGQKKEVRIKGQLVGLKGQKQTAVFRLSYRPVNINSDFEVKQVVDVLITDAQIDVAVTAADKVLAGQDIEFTAVIKNMTTEKLSKVDIELGLPKDFGLVSSEPKLSENHWRGDLAISKPLSIVVKAKVAPDAEGQQAWVVDIKQAVGEDERRLLRKELAVTVIKPDFDIDLRVNGQSERFEVEYGETLNYQLKIINRSTSAINDLKISALLDSDVIDRKTIQSAGLIANQSIVWTKEHVPELASLTPATEVIIPWKATLLPQGAVGRASVDTVVTMEIEGLANWTKNSPVFVVNVGKGLVFNQGLYWNLGGNKVGSGNLPPVTNERTVYLAVWSLDSGNQDFDSVNISTFLPPKVSFVSTEEVDEGTVKFDEETSRLEWQINNFSSKLLPLKASFFVKLVPQDEDKGTVMSVLNPATIVASGAEVFENKSFGVTTAQVISTQEGDVGTIVE